MDEQNKSNDLNGLLKLQQEAIKQLMSQAKSDRNRELFFKLRKMLRKLASAESREEIK